ncbi:ribbon-helix-helix protein, CopG family [Microbacterium sp. ARD31]|uniref:ribbon-helix-helix domain-containing protein n=1 Tax=Microbacterium sp. ARD31 TaxID=2962576 RepID=UPI002880BEFE|nr:ribbon-helix-helix protein, CopG family [Microbacterium sp. ARD31]MDT0186821.1 ribbon-helix-helix protein, CopG family [Microbacterium sp. ARD31]
MTSPSTNPTTPTTPTNDVAIVVRLPQDLREALKARAAAEDRSVASVMRLAARQYVESEVTL